MTQLADVRRAGDTIEVVLDGEVIGVIKPTEQYGLPGVCISSSSLRKDEWLPGTIEAVKRICRRAGCAAPTIKSDSRVKVAGGFRQPPSYMPPELRHWLDYGDD